MNDFGTITRQDTDRLAKIVTPSRRSDGAATGVFWLNGLRSSMRGDKATAIARWCAQRDIGCVRFDYRGHGESPGRFEDHVFSDWLSDSIAMFEAHTNGRQIVIGSSMGGWLAVRLAEYLYDRESGAGGEVNSTDRTMRQGTARQDPPALGDMGRMSGARIGALILIAPAIDMTERLIWSALAPDLRIRLERDGWFDRRSEYGDGDYRITMNLIRDGRRHLIGDRQLVFPFPVHILHGVEDPDVPLGVSEDLCSNLAGTDVSMTPIADGDRRLSRPEDITRLLAVLAGIYERISASPEAQSAERPSR